MQRNTAAPLSRALRSAGTMLGVALLAFQVFTADALAAMPRNLNGDVSNHALPPLVPQQVGAHSWYLRGALGPANLDNLGYNSNAGFVVTPSGVVAFDALGTPALGDAMLQAIATVTDQPVRLLVISHFHADHFYGIEAFRKAGARVLALDAGRDAWHSERSAARLAQRQADLVPWVPADMKLQGADEWVAVAVGETRKFTVGGVDFLLVPGAAAHTREDLMLLCIQDQVLFAGDVYFSGRIPFVGDANTRAWLAALDGIAATHAQVVVPGHGPASQDVVQDLRLTRDYLKYLRQAMGAAARELVDFDQAYRDTDWKAWSMLPAFAEANRINAYGVYLEMQQEALRQP